MTRHLVIAAVLGVASPAGATPRNTVKAHIDKATQAHKDGNFDLALEELKAAYALDPQPDLLFAIGQVYVKLDRCGDAIAYYEQFLAKTKDDQAKQVVGQAIDACKAKLAEAKPGPAVAVVEPKPEPEPKPKPTPEPTLEPKPEPTPEPTPAGAGIVVASARPPWYKDPLGDALVGGGVVAGVVALVFRGAAQSEADKANAPGLSESAYREHLDRSESKEQLSLILGVTAGALITGGIVRYVTRGGGRREAARVGLAPVRDGGFVTVVGRF